MSDSDKAEDAKIVRSVLSGHPEDFNQLVLKYEGRLQRLALRFVSDHAEAKDIVQESFIRAYQGLETFRGDSGFFTWVYRITINTAKNYINVKDRKMIVKCGLSAEELDNLFDEHDLRYEDQKSTPEQDLHLNEVRDNVMHIIDELPEDLKVTLTLREVGGMSYGDIATIMHCPVGTIRSRLHRARVIISQHLDSE